MFICVPDSIKSCITDVSPSHWRVQAVIISSKDSRTLLINSYFPFDKRGGEDDIHELIETLGVIKNVVRNCDCDAVIWVGDINADYTRNTPHSRAVRDSVDDLNLIKV